MKRNEMKVGETYAVLAPSQKVSGTRYGFPAKAKKVIVVDLEPVWTQGYRSWRTEDKPATVIIDGTTYAVDDDQTHKAGTYGDAEAKRSVKVIVVDEDSYSARQNGGQYLTMEAVPLSQVRMTWAEYAAEAKAEEDRGRRERNARDAAYRAARAKTEKAEAERDALNEVLAGTDLKARVLDGEVVLAGPLEVLRAIIETANDQSFRKAV